MAIRNNNIELGYQSLFIPSTSFTGVGILDPDPVADGDTVEITASGSGNAPLRQVDSTGLIGLQMGNNNRVQTLLPMPTFIDIDSDVFVRCWWVSTGASGAFTPTVTYDQFGDRDAIPAESAGKTALDVAIPSDAVDADDKFHVTDAGTIFAGQISFDQNDALELQVSAGLTTLSSVFFLGLELWYMPKLTPGAQKTKVALPQKVVVAE